MDFSKTMTMKIHESKIHEYFTRLHYRKPDTYVRLIQGLHPSDAAFGLSAHVKNFSVASQEFGMLSLLSTSLPPFLPFELLWLFRTICIPLKLTLHLLIQYAYIDPSTSKKGAFFAKVGVEKRDTKPRRTLSCQCLDLVVIQRNGFIQQLGVIPSMLKVHFKCTLRIQILS